MCPRRVVLTCTLFAACDEPEGAAPPFAAVAHPAGCMGGVCSAWRPYQPSDAAHTSIPHMDGTAHGPAGFQDPLAHTSLTGLQLLGSSSAADKVAATCGAVDTAAGVVWLGGRDGVVRAWTPGAR